MFADVVFDIDALKRQISKYGFVNFWDMFIQTYVYKQRPDLESNPSIIDIDLSSKCFELDNIGDLYEIALEYVNKISKKELGQYYTPADVANFMSIKLINSMKTINDVLKNMEVA